MIDKVTRLSTNHNLFKENGEPKWYWTEVLLLTSLTPYCDSARPNWLTFNHKNHYWLYTGVGIAQLVECLTKKPGTVLTQVGVPGVARVLQKSQIIIIKILLVLGILWLDFTLTGWRHVHRHLTTGNLIPTNMVFLSMLSRIWSVDVLWYCVWMCLCVRVYECACICLYPVCYFWSSLTVSDNCPDTIIMVDWMQNTKLLIL